MLSYLLDTVGFSDSLQGILGTVATFTCGASLFAVFLSGKRVKRICVVGNTINQLCFVILYLFPLFEFSPKLKTVLLLTLLLLGHLMNKALFSSRTNMFMCSVPADKRGIFTATKEMISLAGGITISLVMGRVADTFRRTDGLPTKKYYVICAVALLLMTLIHTASLTTATEKPIENTKKTSLRDTMKKIITNTTFTKVVVVGLFWNVASAFSVSFFASYLREELAFNFTVIAILTTVGSLARIVASPVMGRIADKYSFATSMTIAFILAGLGFVAIIFTVPDTRWLYVAYACLHGFGTAGIHSGLINCIYDYVPREDRAIALSVKNAIGGILTFFTALISGVIMTAIQKNGGFTILGVNLYAQQVLSFISFIAVTILIAYMRIVIAPLKKVES
jgi:MFS family permease